MYLQNIRKNHTDVQANQYIKKNKILLQFGRKKQIGNDIIKHHLYRVNHDVDTASTAMRIRSNVLAL